MQRQRSASSCWVLLLSLLHESTAQAITGALRTEVGEAKCAGTLSTDWTQPTSCSDLTIIYATNDAGIATERSVFRGGQWFFPTQSQSCMPPRTTADSQGLDYVVAVYYTVSSAACPTQWLLASTTVGSDGTGTGACCPPGYSIKPTFSQLCLATGASACGDQTAAAFATGIPGLPQLVTSSVSIDFDCTASALPINVRWPLMSTSFTTSSTRTTSSSPLTTTPASTSAAAESSTPALPRTTTIALGVAVPVGTIALLALVFFWCWRQRKRSREHHGQQPVAHYDPDMNTIAYPGATPIDSNASSTLMNRQSWLGGSGQQQASGPPSTWAESNRGYYYHYPVQASPPTQFAEVPDSSASTVQYHGPGIAYFPSQMPVHRGFSYTSTEDGYISPSGSHHAARIYRPGQQQEPMHQQYEYPHHYDEEGAQQQHQQEQQEHQYEVYTETPDWAQEHNRFSSNTAPQYNLSSGQVTPAYFYHNPSSTAEQHQQTYTSESYFQDQNTSLDPGVYASNEARTYPSTQGQGTGGGHW